MAKLIGIITIISNIAAKLACKFMKLKAKWISLFFW